MRLTHIPHETCPHCGANPVAETRTDQHCNGDWNESRSFSCGMRVRYSPNFKSLITVNACPNTPEYRNRKEKRTTAKMAVIDLIKSADCDDEFKSRLLDAIAYCA